MKYAIIINGAVSDIIELLPLTVGEFPNAVAVNGVPVDIGDTYADGAFYRESKRMLSPAERLVEITNAFAEGVNSI